jgi:hypothetical protein
MPAAVVIRRRAWLSFEFVALTGPPGLWLAVRMIPPYALADRMTPLTHGVDMMAFSPVMIFLTPLAAAMRMIMMAASLLW